MSIASSSVANWRCLKKDVLSQLNGVQSFEQDIEDVLKKMSFHNPAYMITSPQRIEDVLKKMSFHNLSYLHYNGILLKMS